MLLRLFSSVAIAGLVAAGSIAQVARSDDVGTISCTPLGGGYGALKIEGIPPTWQRSLAVIGDTLQNDTLNQNEQFFFENCTSTFMNKPPVIGNGSAVYYGHIALANASSLCLSNSANSTSVYPYFSNQFITVEPCSMDDDSSQMLQFWKITFGMGLRTHLNFVGNSTGNENNCPTSAISNSTSLYPTINCGSGGTDWAEIILIPI